MKIFQIIMV